MARKSDTVISVAVFILLEVAAFCMLAFGNTIQNLWIGRGFTTVKVALWGNLDRLFSYFNLTEENDRLARENCRLLEKLSENGNDSTTCIKIGEGGDYSFLNAEVVTMTSGSQHNYLIVNRGEDDGVEVDDGVITSRGAIGVVTAVSANYSYVISYANQEMAISARIGGKGSVGSVRWTGLRSDESVLSGIPLHSDVAVGDTAFTSGFSSIFPAGIPIGIVKSKTIENGSTADFTLKLLEDFKNVHHVFIVKNLHREEIKSLENVQ